MKLPHLSEKNISATGLPPEIPETFSRFSSEAPQICDLSLKDLPEIVEVHLSAFPESALTQIGGETVRRYYEWQMKHAENALIIGAFLKNQMAGFCFAGKFFDATSGFLRRNSLFIFWQIVSHPRLLQNVLIREKTSFGIKVLKKKFFRNSEAKKSKEKQNPHPESINLAESFGILSIAVSRRFQGYGIGQALMRTSEAAARQRNFRQMHLSVHTDNLSAVRFYEKCGWQPILIESVWKGDMKKTLSDVL